MPITVQCTCGKVFRVKDEFQGKRIRCQVCKQLLDVPETAAASPAAAPPARPAPGPAPTVVMPIFDGGADATVILGPQAAAAQAAAAQAAQAAQAATVLQGRQLSASAFPGHGLGQAASAGSLPEQATLVCPGCAEAIPAGAQFCPYCGERSGAEAGAGMSERLLEQAIESIDQHMARGGGGELDATIRGAFLTTRSKVALGLLLGCCLIAVPGFVDENLVGLAIFGVLFALAFAIAAIVSLVNDKRTLHIHDSPDAATAAKCYLLALRTRRFGRAFSVLAPSARRVGGVPTPTLSIVPSDVGKTHSITNPRDFEAYWRSFVIGPSAYSRTVALASVHTLHERPDGVTAVNLSLKLTSYHKAIWIVLLASLLIGVILMLALQKKETVTVTKLLIKRNGRWFIADGELEGPADKVPIH